MALLKTTPPDQAQGKLKELYQMTEQYFGMVPNNVRMLGISPKVLENQLDLIEYYMPHPTLKPALLAMIRMLVSAGCKSPYCEALNTGILQRAGVPAEQIEACKKDVNQVPLDEKDKTLLLLVLKATDNPHSVSAQDIESVKAAGWSEQDIFDAVAHGARMVGTNIIFDTFKIDPE